MASKLKDGWFTEYGPLWPGQAMSIEIEKTIMEERSELQEIVVYKSKTYGNVLVLDGVIQLTDRDWPAYQEMITHIGMLAHPNPERVLIIGGGDGGVIGEVLKHKSIKQIVLVEIDKLVIEVCKKYFPQFVGWDDPKVTVLIADGAKYLAENQSQFDVIIVDSSDPVGPAETLFTKSFYDSLKGGLRPGGIIVQQAENVWLHLDIIKKLVDNSKGIFKSVDYCYTTIPTYPGGQIGFLLSSNEEGKNFREPLRKIHDAFVQNASLEYYTEAIHRAAFVLPRFAAQHLKLEK